MGELDRLQSVHGVPGGSWIRRESRSEQLAHLCILAAHPGLLSGPGGPRRPACRNAEGNRQAADDVFFFAVRRCVHIRGNR
jgi:hypothetical protein